MPQFLADHNFNDDILHGIGRRGAAFEVTRARDVGLDRVADSEVLAWAARFGMVVLTHDVATLVAAAEERVRGGLAMPGVVAVPSLLPVGVAIQSLMIVASCATAADLADSVTYLPL